MTADPFAGVFLDGRPGVADLLALLDAQGYAVRVAGGKPVLSQVRKGGDPAVVKAVAKVLAREPYRSAVLSLAPTAVPAAAALPQVPEPAGDTCPTCRAWVAGQDVICGKVKCPYKRVTWGDPQAEGGVWKPWS